MMIPFSQKGKYVTTTEQLFNTYYVRLCDFASRILDDDEAAQDIVQDVFVTVWEQQDDLPKEDLALRSFLYSSVKFACYNKLRHLKVVNKFEERFLRAEEPKNQEIMEQIIHAEVMYHIYKAIEELPKGCALIFKKGYLEGLKNAEIAQELNLSINTVKSQKQRALSLLKEKLSPQLVSLLIPFIFHKF
ncbi:RNA polymerase sigma-70 factor [Olivibacter ginsenosidimutans]|uniref:RNA polymerase sigma-70 factor n=1 Tax=Olivibacter ginsenosidimutans TaxID=1176537 RepID=A0ABP9BPA3_9SPHI